MPTAGRGSTATARDLTADLLRRLNGRRDLGCGRIEAAQQSGTRLG